MITEDFKLALKEQGDYAEIDRHFASFIDQLAGGNNSELAIAAALVSRSTREGNICIDLNDYAEKSLSAGETNDPIICPVLDTWLEKIRSSKVGGIPGQYRPLIVDDKARLYSYRYWEYENSLGEFIKNQAEILENNFDQDVLKDSLNRLFPHSVHGELNYQKLAAFTAASKRFSIITGGPGTGKTFTVAKILILLFEQNPDIKIALVAPTGKAAARLQESISNSIEDIDCSERTRNLIPQKASTIHRLLGSMPGSPYFKYNAHNRLPHDAVIVDEASMVDLPLMAKLMQALTDRSKLILIGDKDQLASVEAGAVLGDICSVINNYSYTQEFGRLFHELTGDKITVHAKAMPESPIRDAITELKESFRFDKTSGIGALSGAVNSGDSILSADILVKEAYPDIKWSTLPEKELLTDALRKIVINNYSDYLKAPGPEAALERFAMFQVMCAVREGPFGIEALNYYIERILQQEDLISPDSAWYKGRPILITKNDYRLELYNGDIGIILPDLESDSELKACFIMPDGSLRKLSPLRLPEHETVYAMTVHKSQGSEFERALLILPDRETPVVTRELIYTATTRAKNYLEVWCSPDIFKKGIEKKIRRVSGLTDNLHK